MDYSFPLPFEVIKNIYKYISIEEKIFIMPKVSKIWHSICKQDKNLLEEFARSVFENKIKQCNYNDQQISKIIFLSKNNNLISELKKINCECLIGKENVSLCQLPIKYLNSNHCFLLSCSSMDGYSEYFRINYDSINFILSTKSIESPEFRCEICFKIFRIRHIFQQRECYRNFCIEDFFTRKFKKKKLLRWSKLSNKDNFIEKKTCSLIEDVLLLQTTLYINYFSHLNLSMISIIDDHIFKKNEFDLSFFCNENGLIIDPLTENSNPMFCFVIQKKNLANKSPVIIWYSEDYKNKKRLECTLKDVFRWSVYTLTTQKFAEKIGIFIG